VNGKRIVLEGGVIVVSILLAFGIDAAWEEYKERREEQEILSALKFEYEKNLESIREVIAFHERARDQIDKMVVRTEEQIRSLEPKILSEFILGMCNPWSFDAILGTTDALISSGKLDILEDPELRIALTTFINLVQDATEDSDFMGWDAQRVWVAEIDAGGPWTDPATEVGLKGDAIGAPRYLPSATADDVLRVIADQKLMGLIGRCHLNVGYYLSEIYLMRDQATLILGLIGDSQ